MPKITTFSIQVDAFEVGVLMGLIESAEERAKPSLSRIRKQLIVISKEIERLAGVVKTLLPDGRLEIKDADGNRFVRPPHSWEIEGN